MCTNCRPPRRNDIPVQLRLLQPTFEYRSEAWPTYLAPILMAMPPGNDFTQPGAGDSPLEWREAMFGMVPFWSKDLKIARQTYNARSETVAERSSYRGPWGRRRLCLVPAQCFYEPNYESGKPVRWRIERQDGEPFALAGIWETWDTRGADGKKDGNRLHSFSMLTINADQHPLMRRPPVQRLQARVESEMPYGERARDPETPYLVYAFEWRKKVVYIGIGQEGEVRHTDRWKHVARLRRCRLNGTMTVKGANRCAEGDTPTGGLRAVPLVSWTRSPEAYGSRDANRAASRLHSSTAISCRRRSHCLSSAVTADRAYMPIANGTPRLFDAPTPIN